MGLYLSSRFLRGLYMNTGLYKGGGLIHCDYKNAKGFTQLSFLRIYLILVQHGLIHGGAYTRVARVRGDLGGLISGGGGL